MALKRRKILKQMLNLGHGTDTVPADSGGSQTGDKIGIHTLLGTAYLNAADFSGADLGAKINAAISALPSAGGTIDVRGIEGTQTATSTITVNKPATILLGRMTLTSSASTATFNLTSSGASVIGGGPNQTTIITSHATADIIKVSAVFTKVSGLALYTSVTRTGGAAINQTSTLGSFSNLRIERTYYGILIGTAGAGNSSFHDISMGIGGGSSAGNWQAGIWVGGGQSLYPDGTSTSIASNFFTNCRITGDLAFGAAMVVIEGATDTLQFTNCDFVAGTQIGGVDAQSMIIRNTTTAADHPRWVHCTNVSMEAGVTKKALYMTQFRDVSFVNSYIASSLIGIDLNSAATTGRKFRWIGGVILSIQQAAVVIDTCQDVRILGSVIAETGLATNNTYPSIDVAPNTTDFQIIGNEFSNVMGTAANKPSYYVQVNAGTSTRYQITGNNFPSGDRVTGDISDGGTGTDKVVAFNTPISSQTWSSSMRFAKAGVGAAGVATTGVLVTPSDLTGTTQIGLNVAPVVSSGATTEAIGVLARADTAAASFTCGVLAGVFVTDSVKGAGSTITTQYGVYIAAQSNGGTNYGLYSAHTGAHYMAGALTVAGLLTSSTGLTVTGAGVQVGAPTGGDKGAGTINVAGDIYKNNTAYTNPDYVFEKHFRGRIEKFRNNPGAKSYKGLMPLGKLAKYVRTKYRLPGVAKASGLFERSDVLLEKLEEAYLHIIELHERVAKLESK